jgi:hypothetical protein
MTILTEFRERHALQQLEHIKEQWKSLLTEFTTHETSKRSCRKVSERRKNRIDQYKTLLNFIDQQVTHGRTASNLKNEMLETITECFNAINTADRLDQRHRELPLMQQSQLELVAATPIFMRTEKANLAIEIPELIAIFDILTDYCEGKFSTANKDITTARNIIKWLSFFRGLYQFYAEMKFTKEDASIKLEVLEHHVQTLPQLLTVANEDDQYVMFCQSASQKTPAEQTKTLTKLIINYACGTNSFAEIALTACNYGMNYVRYKKITQTSHKATLVSKVNNGLRKAKSTHSSFATNHPALANIAYDIIDNSLMTEFNEKHIVLRADIKCSLSDQIQNALEDEIKKIALKTSELTADIKNDTARRIIWANFFTECSVYAELASDLSSMALGGNKIGCDDKIASWHWIKDLCIPEKSRLLEALGYDTLQHASRINLLLRLCIKLSSDRIEKKKIKGKESKLSIAIQVKDILETKLQFLESLSLTDLQLTDFDRFIKDLIAEIIKSNSETDTLVKSLLALFTDEEKYLKESSYTSHYARSSRLSLFSKAGEDSRAMAGKEETSATVTSMVVTPKKEQEQFSGLESKVSATSASSDTAKEEVTGSLSTLTKPTAKAKIPAPPPETPPRIPTPPPLPTGLQIGGVVRFGSIVTALKKEEPNNSQPGTNKQSSRQAHFPPGPPPPMPPNLLSKPKPTSSAPADLLASIRTGKTLKKTTSNKEQGENAKSITPSEKPPSLLDEICKGKKLKKLKKLPKPKPKKEGKKSIADLLADKFKNVGSMRRSNSEASMTWDSDDEEKNPTNLLKK